VSHRTNIEWMGTRVDTLADLLPSSTRAVIIGVNPAPISVEAGHYYQGQLGQRLWQRLERCGLLIRTVGQWEDDDAVAAGFGFTDIVKRPTSSAGALHPGEREHGAASLLNNDLLRTTPFRALGHNAPPISTKVTQRSGTAT
jgi:double-stranded uracil-DNA glycosylase